MKIKTTAVAIDSSKRTHNARRSNHRGLYYREFTYAFKQLFDYRAWHYNATIKQNFSAEELIYYPELAQELRALPEYPEIIRDYTIDPEGLGEGIGLLRQLAALASNKEALFDADYDALENKVTELVSQYGQLRYLPLIDEILSKEIDYRFDNSTKTIITDLVISGVTWGFQSAKEDCSVKKFCWSKLFNLPDEISAITLEEATIGTPFVGLRLRANWRAKGHIKWYSLDTRQAVTKADRLAWQKLHQAK
jgi:hypothetical protein